MRVDVRTHERPPELNLCYTDRGVTVTVMLYKHARRPIADSYNPELLKDLIATLSGQRVTKLVFTRDISTAVRHVFSNICQQVNALGDLSTRGGVPGTPPPASPLMRPQPQPPALPSIKPGDTNDTGDSLLLPPVRVPGAAAPTASTSPAATTPTASTSPSQDPTAPPPKFVINGHGRREVIRDTLTVDDRMYEQTMFAEERDGVTTPNPAIGDISNTAPRRVLHVSSRLPPEQAESVGQKNVRQIASDIYIAIRDKKSTPPRFDIDTGRQRKKIVNYIFNITGTRVRPRDVPAIVQAYNAFGKRD